MIESKFVDLADLSIVAMAGIREEIQKTGQLVQVPPKRVPFFKVGKELKEMVDYHTPEKKAET